MAGFLKKLWRDRRGNALVITAGAMPLVLGSAGLATDTVQWATSKRQLQRAADSAALAGAYALAQSQGLTSAVNTDLGKNNHVSQPLLASYPAISQPADTATMKSQVEVALAIAQELPFSSIFLTAAPVITATARAAMIPDGQYCVVALDNSAGSGITISGSANANLGCGVISNSVSPTASVGTNGNSYNLTASPVAGVGGMPTAINGATNIQPYHLAMQDPFAGKYSTDVPAGMSCNGANTGTNSYTVTTGTGQNRVVTTHLRGDKCYSNFNIPNGTVVLDPGVYYLSNTSITLNGNSNLTGTGVTLIFTGTTPGTINMNGNSFVNLTAPTTGTYAKMLMIQSPNATSGNDNTINGNNGGALDGAIYFPKADLTFTGSSSAATKCAMVVSLTVAFGGNTDIQNNTTGCTANQTATGAKIRLVA